jgi:hypothetical protein
MAQQGNKDNVARAHAQQQPLPAARVPESRGMVTSLLHLQRTQGNRYVQQLLHGAELQRKFDGVDIYTECHDERHTLPPRLTEHTELTAAPPIVQEVLRAPGHPLDSATRTIMGAGFGYDFSQVKIHTDTKAGQSARAVNALAYTVGRDVVFGIGQYAPETGAGRRLLAHEMTHVVQQSTTSPNTASLIRIADDADTSERVAQTAANWVTNGLNQRRKPASIEMNPPSPVGASVLQRKPDIQSQPIEQRYNLSIGDEVLENVTSTQALVALRRHYQRLSLWIQSDRERHRMQRQIREDQWLVGGIADAEARVFMPPESIWSTPQIYLDAARSTLNAGHVEASVRNLARAEPTWRLAHRLLYAYIGGTISGAETSATVLKVTAAAGAVAATVLSGGLAASAEAGLLGTSTAVGVGGGLYGAAQEFSGQAGERFVGDRQHFEVGAILRRGAVDAVTNFVGAFAGGAISRYATRSFGSYLSKISNDELRELGELLGLRGPLPRDFFLTRGQRLIADFLGGVGSTLLTTAVSTVVNRLTEGGPWPNLEQLVRMVIDEMVHGGAVQIFLGTFLHGHVPVQPARGGQSGPSAGGRRIGSRGSSFRGRVLGAMMRGVVEATPITGGTGGGPSFIGRGRPVAMRSVTIPEAQPPARPQPPRPAPELAPREATPSAEVGPAAQTQPVPAAQESIPPALGPVQKASPVPTPPKTTTKQSKPPASLVIPTTQTAQALSHEPLEKHGPLERKGTKTLQPDKATTGEVKKALKAQEMASQSIGTRAKERKKAFAVSESESAPGVPRRSRTASGWKFTPERSAIKVTPEQVKKHAEEIGHTLTPNSLLDQQKRGGFPGRYHASHAEKKQIVARPNAQVGVNLPMCDDCIEFFKREARYRKKTQIVSDRQATRVFEPDGTVTEYWEDGSVVRLHPDGSASAEPGVK